MLITILKFLLLGALSPIWWPVLRELYREIEAALLEEGGLLGQPPTPDELKELREKYKDYHDPLVSVPWAEAREQAAKAKSRSARDAARAGGSGGGRSAGGGGTLFPKARNAKATPVRAQGRRSSAAGIQTPGRGGFTRS